MAQAITKSVLEQFRVDFRNQVKELETKYGFVIELGNITYGSDSFTGKLNVRQAGVSKYAEQAEYFKRVYHLYGLQQDMLNKTFMACGKKLKFVGIDNKKYKYPCICTLADDENVSYKMSVEQINKALLSQKG